MNLNCVTFLAALLLAAPTPEKKDEPLTGPVVRPVPRTKVVIRSFTASGFQYWEPDRGAAATALFRSRLTETGRFTVLDSLAWARDDSLNRSRGTVEPARYELRGEILKLGVRSSLVVSAVEPLDGGAGETVRSWREDLGNIGLLDSAVRRIVKQVAAEFPLRHLVVRVERSEADIELGTIDGLKEGQTLTVYSRLGEVRHPRTGMGLEWRLMPLGRIEVVQVGRRLSRARIVEERYPGSIQPGAWIE